MKPDKTIAAAGIYAFAFGLFLGLTIWKFGNPVILDHKIIPPSTPSEFWHEAWPTHWANWVFLPLALGGALIFFRKTGAPLRRRAAVPLPRRHPIWLWLLPLLWFGWQLVAATQTVDADLTAATLWQFFGCIGCYFVGALIIGSPNNTPGEKSPSQHAGAAPGAPSSQTALSFLLIGIMAAFAFCLVRAVDQRLVEFPQSRQMLVEGERDGWTNVPPAMLLEMKQEQVIITTNGVEMANPLVLAKFSKGRVMGTLVYPNALAGAILLLLPPGLTLAFGARKLRPTLRVIVITLACFLGGAAFFWTGSKLGWLVAMIGGGLYLLRMNWPVRWKCAALAIVVIVGLGIFAVRFHNYFAAGATSAGARLDYWRAAVQTTAKNPLTGTGPGTFQRPYEQTKSPDAEMARLAHNDYLEQFSDSGIPGGLLYGTWIVLALATIWKRAWKDGNQILIAVFIGLLGWFVQGLGEFSLYIPALAWTAFTLLGCSLALTGNRFDKNPTDG